MKIRRGAAVLVLDLLLVASCATSSTAPASAGAAAPLRFENTPIFEVAVAVSERTGSPFAIDPGVAGKISLIVPAHATGAQVVTFFRAALTQAGFDVLPIDGGFRLVARPAGAAVDPPAAESGRVPVDEFLKAAGSGSLDVVQRYLAEGGNPNVAGRNDETALTAAAAGGHLGVVRELVEHGAAVSYAGVGYRSSPPLLRALQNRQAEVARFLIERGANVKAEAGRGTSPLMVAAHRKDADLVKLLLARGASPHETTESGQRPLSFAAEAGDAAVATLLLEAGASVRWMEGTTPAAAAARGGWPQMLEPLAKRGADLDAALVEIVAQGQGTEKAVSLLLAAGARPGARNRQGRTALMLAAGAGSPESVQLLLKAGAEVAARDPEGLTALAHSFRIAYGAQALTGRLLVDAGAEIDARDGYGRTALHYAALRSSSEGVLYLLSKKADHAVQDEEGNTAMHYAAQGRTPGLARILEDAGADPGIRNAAGQTPVELLDRSTQSDRGSRRRAPPPGDGAASARFTEAAMRADTAAVLALLGKGQNPNCFAPGKPTALLSAVGSGDLDLVRALVEAGAAVDFRGEEHAASPIVRAARECRVPIVAYLLDKGASPLSGRQGESLLAAVAGCGDFALVKRLVKLGADIRADDSGLGPLSAAADGGYVEVVKFLLEAGASPNDLPAQNSMPPLALAAAAGHDAVIKLLLDAGADPAAALKAVAAGNRFGVSLRERSSARAENRPPRKTRENDPQQAIGPLAAAAGSVDARDARGETALHAAVRAANDAAVRALLDLKADPAAVNFAGQGMLHVALEQGVRPAIVQALVAAGTPVDLRDAFGKTALMSAAGSGGGDTVAECMLLLVQKGADVNAADAAGDTPLHYSARAGNTNGVLLLLQTGADRARRNREGKRPVELAAVRSGDAVKRALSLPDAAPAARPAP